MTYHFYQRSLEGCSLSVKRRDRAQPRFETEEIPMSMPSLARAIAAAVLSVSALASSGAGAQNFERPVRLIVPFAPGGTSDILARLISPKLSAAIGQSVVVENKPGAAGNLGADAVAKAQPDGHTLLLMDVA